MRTIEFWRASGERAIKTFAQALAATLSVSGLTSMSVGWQQALATAGLAALLSLLTSVGSSTVGSSGSPSLIVGQK